MRSRAKRSHLERRRSLWLPGLAAALAVATWGLTLRPVAWGGSMTYVVVQGSSMEPTYTSGDLVLVREANEYQIGDVVAYRLPEGAFGAGNVLIHRVTDQSTEGYVIQGDANLTRDDVSPFASDIIGRAVVRVPRGGVVLVVLRDRLALASLAAGATASWLLFSAPRPARHIAKRNRGRYVKRSSSLSYRVGEQFRSTPRSQGLSSASREIRRSALDLFIRRS